MLNNFTLVLTLQAVEEIQNITERYESKTPDLGSRFLEVVHAGLKKIVLRPTAFARHKRTGCDGIVYNIFLIAYFTWLKNLL